MNCPSRIDHRLAIVLLATDAAFVFLHLAGPAVFHNPLLSLYHDGGFAEWFQYTKEFWAFVLLAILAARRRSPLFFSLSLLFVYILLDDSRRVHEKLGGIVASRGGLQSQNLGELVAAAAVGAILLVPIGLAYLRSDRDTRRTARWVLGLTALFATFGGVLDALNTVVTIGGRELMDLGGELIEEIGELMVMSAIVTFVFGLVPARLAARSSRDATRTEDELSSSSQPARTSTRLS